MDIKGKYDGAASVARNMTGAAAVLLVVIGGNQGHGFTVQALDKRILDGVPDMLEEVARQIREQAARDAAA